MSKKDKESSAKEELEAEKEVEEALKEVGAKEGEASPKLFSMEQIAEMEKKAALADQSYDKMLRMQAEIENQKKRLVREKEEFAKFANESLIESFLPVLDNFERAIEHAQKDYDPKHILDGVKMIQKLFEATLQKHGLTVISALGEKFNPHQQEAIAFEETDDEEEGKVVQVFQQGFLLHGRLLRPATVKITKKKTAESKEK